jgi:hypothetical protein
VPYKRVEDRRRQDRQAKKRAYSFDPEKHRAKAAAWRRANPDKVKAIDRKYRLGQLGITPDSGTQYFWRKGSVAPSVAPTILATNAAGTPITITPPTWSAASFAGTAISRWGT